MFTVAFLDCNTKPKIMLVFAQYIFVDIGRSKVIVEPSTSHLGALISGVCVRCGINRF